VANAEAVRAQVIAEGLDPAKVFVIHNGLDASRYAVDAAWDEGAWRRARGLPAGSPLVTIVANLRHGVKDQAMFLRGAAAIHARVPGAAFILAGEGGLMEPMRELAASLGLAGCTYFLGRVTEVRELLAATAICTLTSKAEGFSNAILEYMAASRPVVATNVGGAAECVREGVTGFLVPSGDDAAFADRVVQLLEDPARGASMGAQGRVDVLAKFSREARLGKTEALYDAILTGRT
jgi:glycosyltransferase EpsD